VRRIGRWALLVVLAALSSCSSSSATSASGSGPASGSRSASAVQTASSDAAMPPIGHVFIIVLENESAATTFGPNSPAPYLSKTLPAEGAYLPHYYGIGHNSNDNYIAMISGQAPNLDTMDDCLSFTNFNTGHIGTLGQQEGEGCVYPSDISTIANQLDDAGDSWGDFNDSMGADPTREASECGHPAVGALDNTQSETARDQYATRHNPFVYFHSIIDSTTLCDTHVVNLNLLPVDLESMSTTPSYVFITPGLCNDGHDATCESGNGKGGLAQADAFLNEWVPKITGSPAFRQQNGLLIITFDEADSSDASACCGEISGATGIDPGRSGPGGGDVGAVLLSPCIAPGTVSQTAYNHYTMLRSIEDMFGLSHLGYAQLPGEATFGSDIFTGSCSALPVTRIRVRAAGPRTVRLRWSATHDHGPGVATYTVQVRRGAGRWRTLKGLAATAKGTSTFDATAGGRYRFRARATDTLGRAGTFATSRELRLPPAMAQ
jgi:hypothetical protein